VLHIYIYIYIYDISRLRVNSRCSTYSSSENTTCSFLVQAAQEKLKEDRETEAPRKCYTIQRKYVGCYKRKEKITKTCFSSMFLTPCVVTDKCNLRAYVNETVVGSLCWLLVTRNMLQCTSWIEHFSSVLCAGSSMLIYPFTYVCINMYIRIDHPMSVHNTANLNMELFVNCLSVSVNVFVQYWQRDVDRNGCGRLVSYCAWFLNFMLEKQVSPINVLHIARLAVLTACSLQFSNITALLEMCHNLTRPCCFHHQVGRARKFV